MPRQPEGFWWNTFVSNTREKAAAGTVWYRANQPNHCQVSHIPCFFSAAPLWPPESSNHSPGLNPDLCKKERSGDHMQTKCCAMPSESRSEHLVDNLNINSLSVPAGVRYTVD